MHWNESLYLWKASVQLEFHGSLYKLRENGRDNREWTIQRNIHIISCDHKTQDEDKEKQNTTQYVWGTIYVNNTNNVNNT